MCDCPRIRDPYCSVCGKVGSHKCRDGTQVIFRSIYHSQECINSRWEKHQPRNT